MRLPWQNIIMTGGQTGPHGLPSNSLLPQMQQTPVQVIKDLPVGPLADVPSPHYLWLLSYVASMAVPTIGNACATAGHPLYPHQEELRMATLLGRCWFRSQWRGGRNQYQGQKLKKNTYNNQNTPKPQQQQQNSCYKQSALGTAHLDS